MKRRVKQIIITMMVTALLFSAQAVYAESILPSLSEMIGVAMPSLGEALKKYPDSETENEDGSITEQYSHVTNKDYETFGTYMGKMGAELGEYKVEGGVLTAEIRCNGSACSFSYDNAKQEAKMTYPAGTYDKWTKDAKDHYNEAQLLLEEDRIEDALAEIFMIQQYDTYAPVTDLLKDNIVLSAEVTKNEEKLKAYRTVGSMVTFGRYEQNTEVDGKEEIEWIVLDYDENEDKALLVSRYALDSVPFCRTNNPDEMDNDWEKSTLRGWLNDSFLMNAFSEKEQAAILLTEVDNSPSQGCDWVTYRNDSKNTYDQVFLLSCAESKRYPNVSAGGGSIMARIAPTQYAIAMGAYIPEDNFNKTSDGKDAVGWWLRSPGSAKKYAAVVGGEGTIWTEMDVSLPTVGTRPALWLDLNAYLSATGTDGEQTNTKKHLSEAERLLSEGKTIEAIRELIKIPQYDEYAPAKDMIQSNPDLAAIIKAREEKLVPFRTPGSTVAFGTYEQDRSTKNGQEPIEWIVLEYIEKDDKVLLISRYGLDAMPYNGEKDAETNWEACSLRSELNGTFLNDAFTAEEQAAILTTEVDNSSAQGFSGWETDGGNNTQDKVFLLSCTEAKQYFGIDDGVENTEARISATAYANQRGGAKAAKAGKGKTAEGKQAVWWWLRSPGATQNSAANVMNDGSLGNFEANMNQGVVRPAIWLDLNADIFWQ